MMQIRQALYVANSLGVLCSVADSIGPAGTSVNERERALAKGLGQCGAERAIDAFRGLGKGNQKAQLEKGDNAVQCEQLYQRSVSDLKTLCEEISELQRAG